MSSNVRANPLLEEYNGRIMWIRLSYLPCLFFFLPLANNAKAEEILVSVRQMEAPASAKLSVAVRPGSTIDIIAELRGTDGSGNSDDDGPFHWKASCGQVAKTEECDSSGSFEAGAPLTYQVPLQFGKPITVVINHDSLSNGQSASSAILILMNAEADRDAPAAGGMNPHGKRVSDDEAFVPAKNHKGHHRGDRLEGEEDPSGFNGAGGGKVHGGGHGGGHAYYSGSGSGSGTGSSSEASPAAGGKAPRSRRYSGGSAFEDYYYGGFGGESGSPTTKRGYNRDQEVPVIVCAHELRADGSGLELRCEDSSKKVLRKHVQKKAEKKPEAKVGGLRKPNAAKVNLKKTALRQDVQKKAASKKLVAMK